MITRIELVNFMSHAHTVIEPAPGLTVLIGPNNIGKSAVVAALQILCHNEKSTYVTRHGEKECSITVQTSDGHTVQWLRKTSPAYIIDGKRFDRLRQGNVPDLLHQVLRLPRIDSGSDADFDIHFGAQKDPIFLLRDTGSNAARFFASSSDADRLVAMQKRHKEKHQEAKREKKRLEQRSADLNRELELLQPVVGLEERLDDLERLFESIGQQSDTIAAARTLSEKLQETQRERSRQELQLQSLSSLAAPPVLEPVEPLARFISELPRAQRAREKLVAEQAAVRLLARPPLLQDETDLHSRIDRLHTARLEVDRQAAESRALMPLAQPPAVSDLAPLRATLQEFETFQSNLSRCASVRQSLSGLQPVHPSVDTTPLARDLQELVRCNELANQARQAAAETAHELEDGLRQCREELNGQNCPTCGGPINAEAFLQHLRLAGGAHG